MKRIVSLVLTVLLLLGSFALYGCAQVQDIDLSEHTLIYANDVSDSMKEKIKSFAATLSDTLDVSIKAKVQSNIEGETPAALEILVGNTNRPETEKALKKIKGHGYIITVIGDKLVIVGTTNLLTGMALDAFVGTYCTQKQGTPILSVAKTVCDKMEMVELNSDWALVYSDRLDDSAAAKEVDPNRQPEENKEGYDYPVVATKQIKSLLAKQNGEMALRYKEYSDATVKSDKTVGEILVGVTTRESSRTFIASLSTAQTYGISVQPDRVVVAGAGDVALRAATQFFKNAITDSTYITDEEDQVVLMPKGFEARGLCASEWVSDFPKPTGPDICLAGAVDVADGAVEYYYTGAGISASSFAAYCQSLESAGYRRYMENEIEDSMFYTYVHDTEKITLNVTYCAYKHAAAQKVKLYEPCMRVVAAKLNTARINLIPESLFDLGRGYERKTDTMITAVPLDYASGSYGNCYIITLEDGSYVMLDSGFGGKSNNALLQDAFYALHKKLTGAEPSATNKIHIRAWYLSHGHGDHYTNFYQFSKANKSKLTLDYVITNFPSDAQTYNSYNPNLALRNDLEEYVKAIPGTTYLKVHTGQVFYLGNVKFEVLYTHEDIYPERIHYYNDSSVAIRTTVYHTDGQGNVSAGSVPVTTLWLGDTQTGGSVCMRAMYGTYLQSDQVQIAHHGGTGCELALYELTKSVCIWMPHKKEAYTEIMSKGPKANVGTSTYISYHAFTMPSVKYIIISDFYNTTMTIGYRGANYGLYDAVSNPAGLWHAGVQNLNVTYGSGYVVKR